MDGQKNNGASNRNWTGDLQSHNLKFCVSFVPPQMTIGYLEMLFSIKISILIAISIVDT